MFLILFVFSYEIIDLFFGQEFIQATSALKYISIGLFCNATFGLSYLILEAAAKTKLILMNNSICLILNIILNILFIPVFGVKGAAMATSISMIIVNVLSISQIWKIYKIQSLNLINLKILILGIITVSIGKLISISIFNLTSLTQLIIGMSVFLILYILSLPLIKIFEAHDEIIFKQIEAKIGMKIPFINNFLRK